MSPTLIQTTTGSKPVDTNKIMESLIVASKDLSKVDIFKVYQSTVASLHSGITTDEINILTTKAASGYISEHYEYSYLAARLTLQKLYKEVFGESMYEYEDFYSTRYQEYFEGYLDMGIGYGLLDPALKSFDLNVIKSALVPQRDLVFKEPGMARVYKQYVLKTNNDKQKAFELPQFWLMRVAMGLAVNETNKEQKAIEFYNLLSTQKLLHSTPTLLNSGRIRNQNSSCFLLTVQDDLHNIYKTYSDIAMLSKYAGGIGVDFTNIRATGALIKGTNGKSLGLIPFIKVLDSSAAAVNQGGVRKGAVAAYLEIWHKDIFDFIATKYVSIDENRRCPNIHTVAWIPDLFMKRLINNQDKWTLFSPSDTPDLHSSYGADFEAKYLAYEANENIPKETISLRKLWEEMLTSLLGKGFGHPWITFKDPSNVMNPQKHVGVVNNSNLCTEILLTTAEDETAVCNLSSINIAHFIKGYTHKSESLVQDKGIFESEERAHILANVELPKSTNPEVQKYLDLIDWQDLAETTQVAIRMLDNVIDINYYTTTEAENANTRHRPVGLGLMGMQTLLQKMELVIESEITTEFNDYLFEFINYNALVSSVHLAKEKGQYSTFAGSDWSKGILPLDNFVESIKQRGMTTTTNMDKHLDWETLRATIIKDGMRNCQVMAIAPTRTISYIAGVSPSIEPWDSNVFTEVGMTGKYMMINDELVDTLERHGFWTPEIINKIKKANGSIQSIVEIPQDLRNLFKTAWELHPKFLISQNARRQKWVDMGISFNQWINSTNGSDAERIYIECWKAGLKTTYYLHSKSASQAAKVGLEEEENVIKILPSGAVCDMTDPECEACQ